MVGEAELSDRAVRGDGLGLVEEGGRPGDRTGSRVFPQKMAWSPAIDSRLPVCTSSLYRAQRPLVSSSVSCLLSAGKLRSKNAVQGGPLFSDGAKRGGAGESNELQRAVLLLWP